MPGTQCKQCQCRLASFENSPTQCSTSEVVVKERQMQNGANGEFCAPDTLLHNHPPSHFAGERRLFLGGGHTIKLPDWLMVRPNAAVKDKP